MKRTDTVPPTDLAMAPGEQEAIRVLFDRATAGPPARLPTIRRIRALAAQAGREHPVVSLFLDVGPERRARGGWTAALKDLIKAARERAGVAVSEDLERIEEAMRDGPPAGARAVAFFSCAAERFWERFTLPVAVEDRVEIGPTPYIRPLVWMLDEHEQAMVAVFSEARNRFVLVQAGMGHLLLTVEGKKLREVCSERWDPRRYLTRDERDRAKTTLRHSEAKALAHLLEGLCRHTGIRHILLGAPPDLRRAVIDHLGRDVASCVEPEPFPLLLEESPQEIARRAEPFLSAIEAREEEQAVARLREAGPNGSALGPGAVLDALNARRVRELILLRGMKAPGIYCPHCGIVALARDDGICPGCGARTEDVPDVWELALEAALRQSAGVEIVSSRSAREALEGMGGVGALLRF